MQSNNINFSYELTESGKANASFAYNDVLINFHLSNVCNPLFDLLEGIVSMITNPKHFWGETNDTQIIWYSENDSYNWYFNFLGNNEIIIKLSKSYDFFEENSADEILIDFKCNFLDFIFSIINELDSLVKKVGLLNYAQQWQKGEFPITHFLFLKKYLIDNSYWKQSSKKQCDILSDEILLLLA